MNNRKRQNYKNTKSGVSKAQCQEWHCAKRLRERFGIQLTEGRYTQLVNSLIDPKSGAERGITVEFIRDQSCRVKEFKVKMTECDGPFIACYDADRKTVVTVLFELPDGCMHIHQFYDHFGNTVNARTEYGRFFELDINKQELRIPATDTQFIEQTKETIVWKSEDKKIWIWSMSKQRLTRELDW